MMVEYRNLTASCKHSLALRTISNCVGYWAEYDKYKRDKEGLPTTEDTHIISPTAWPSHGQIGNWVTALTEAADEIERLTLGLRRITNPIGELRKESEAAGMKFNGAVAVALANDAAYLSKIAEAALSPSTGPNEDEK